MANKTISISLDAALYKLLEQRAEKSLTDINTLIEEILRRSMLSYKKSSTLNDKTDDALVSLFSRKGKLKKK